VQTPTPNIWKLQAQHNIAGLTEALTHEDPEVRKRAAAALRALDAVESVPALEAALAIEEDWEVQANISAALQHLGGHTQLEMLIAQRNIDGLVNMLHSPSLEDVIDAATALGDLGDRTATEALVAVFRDARMPDKARLAAAEALLKLRSAPAVVTLLAALRRDDWLVRRNAAAVLGQLRASWATDALAAISHDPHPVVRRTVLAALRTIGTPAALQAAQDAEAIQEVDELSAELMNTAHFDLNDDLNAGPDDPALPGADIDSGPDAP